MATKIPTGTSAYFVDFDGGQGGGASSYFTYAPDLDTNFSLLRTTINQIIDEVSAVSGPNATIALDLVRWNDDENPIDATEPQFGVIGAGSYEVSVEGGGTLKIRRGQCLVLLQKCSLLTDLTGLTSSGGAGTRYVALDAQGIPYIESSPNQRVVDLASVTWNGSIFTGTPTHLVEVLLDGDAWAEIRDRPVTPDVATFPAYTFRRGALRTRALELFLSGHDTGEEGESIDGPLVLLPGAVGAPSLVMGDGSSVFETTTGWFRSGANRWGFTASGAQVIGLRSDGMRFHKAGSAATPILRHTGGAGLYFLNAGVELAAACESSLIFRCKAPTSLPQFLIADGTVAAPALGFDQDEDTGWYAPAAAEIALALAGVKKHHWTAGQYRIPDGAVGAPAIAFEADLDSGLYAPAVAELAIALGGAKKLHLAGDQVRILDGAVGAPSLAADADLDTGMYFPTTAQIAWALAGVKKLHLAGDQLRSADGAVGAPAWTFDADLDTGWYRPGDNRLAGATAGVKRFELDAEGNLDLPTNMSAIVERDSTDQTITTATATSISWDTEDRDVGGWIAVPATDLTVPTGGDGVYMITLEVDWEAIASPNGYRDLWIEAAGATLGRKRFDPWNNWAHYDSTSTIVVLSASDVVRGRVEHTEGSDVDVIYARLAIQKIA